MESIDFKQRNAEIAKDQPQYRTLFAHICERFINEFFREVHKTVCFKLDPEELKQVNDTGCIWLTQVSFREVPQPAPAYTPIRCTTLNPFLVYLPDSAGATHYLDCKYPEAFTAIQNFLLKNGFTLYVDGTAAKEKGTHDVNPLVFSFDQLDTFPSVLEFQLKFPGITESNEVSE